MTIAYRDRSSGTQSGITSVMYRAPVTVEAGDAIVWATACKYPPVTPPAPTGLSLIAHAVAVAGGAAGADTGNVTASAFFREANGTEDAATETISVPGGNSIISRSVAYSRSGGTGWSIASAAGEQTTSSDTWDVTTGSIDLAAGDMLLVCTAKNSDNDLTHSSHTVTATGITFGSPVQRMLPVGTTNGDDCALEIVEVPVTAGSGSVAVRVQINLSGSGGTSAGEILLVRLRESSGSTPVSWTGTVPTLTGTVGVPFSADLAGYTGGTETPFTYAILSGTLPAGLSLSGSVISGTPSAAGAHAIVARVTDAASNTADSNSFLVQIDSPPPADDHGYKALSISSDARQQHTTVSHGFHHDGSWWQMLYDGAAWSLYKETGAVPAAPGDTVNWASSAHLASIHTGVQCTVAVDSANNKAYLLGFSTSASAVQFRVLTYAAGAWSLTTSVNLTNSAGTGLGVATSPFEKHGKLSIAVDSNGVPLVFAGNKGAGTAATNGCHIAWPDNPASLGGTWSWATVDAESISTADASGRICGPVSVGGTNYMVVAYTTDAAPNKTKLAYRAVQATVANYGTGWTILQLDNTLSVDNHVWAGIAQHGGNTVAVVATKCGDGVGFGRLYLYTVDLTTGWGSATVKRHRITNGPGEAGALAETPSRPVCVLDNSNGTVHVVYHSRDSYPYGFVGRKSASLSTLLGAANDGVAFDFSTARNQTPIIFDASLASTVDAKSPAHAVTAAMGYAPVTALVSASSTAGDSVWWARVSIPVDVPLAGSAAVQASASAGLSHGVPLAGTAQGQASASGTLAGGAGLAGSAGAQGSASGDLTHGVPLAGNAQGQGSAGGTLDGGASLSGNASGQAGASGALTHGVALSGNAQGQAGASGNLATSGSVGLSGSAQGNASAAGGLTVPSSDFPGLTAWPGVRNAPLRSKAEPVPIVAPAAEPISLLEARQHLKIDDTNVSDDALIAALIVAARQRAEHETGRRLITQVWDLVLDGFPPASQAIELSSSLIQAQSIVQINYLDAGGVVRAVPLDAFALDAFTLPGYVIPRDGHAWPADAAGTVNSVRVRVACGYGALPTDVPMAIRQWILLQLGAMYENREAFVTGKSVAELPAGFVDRLLDPYRVWTL